MDGADYLTDVGRQAAKWAITDLTEFFSVGG